MAQQLGLQQPLPAQQQQQQQQVPPQNQPGAPGGNFGY
jgi:hypothetical protein